MTITMKSKLGIGLILAAIFATALLLYATVAHANPLQYTNTTQTAAATSSPVYMTPGTATTTLVADSFQSTTGNNYANNKIALLLQFIASSTASQLNMNLEYSNGYPGVDCVATPNACDWYEDNATNEYGFGTTTPNFLLAIIPQYQWKFASSTVGQLAPAANNNRATRLLSINTPARYVRAVFTCAVGGAGCGVWAQFVPSKEVK